MKRTLLGLFASVAMTGTLVAAQDGRAPSPVQLQMPRDSGVADVSKNADTTVTGCLVQGSSPSVFLLEGVKASATVVTPSPSDAAEGAGASASVSATADRGATYRLESESGAKGVDFKTHLNHQVTITGITDAKATTVVAASDKKLDEKSLPKLRRVKRRIVSQAPQP